MSGACSSCMTGGKVLQRAQQGMRAPVLPFAMAGSVCVHASVGSGWSMPPARMQLSLAGHCCVVWVRRHVSNNKLGHQLLLDQSTSPHGCRAYSLAFGC
jgi:hypothetical protein